MLKPECINFDCTEQQVNGLMTDIIGRVQDLLQIFKPETFETILCYHIIEHVYPKEAKKMLADCYQLLRHGGKLVVEAPDIEKILNNWRLEKATTKETIQEIYGDTLLPETWMHKWGWTAVMVSNEMRRAGFTVIMAGEGTSHSKPFRDLRVEGIKQ